MKRTFTNSRSMLQDILSVLFLIHMSKITAENTTRSELIFQEVSLNRNDSNFSWIENTKTGGKIEIHFLDSANNSADTGLCKSGYICQNGGICSEDTGKFCECKQGTSGNNCEIVDECVRNPMKCGNGLDAECIYALQEQKAVCSCKNPEKLFDRKQLMCKVKCLYEYSCWNGAKCLNNLCECLPGTSGDTCKTVDACNTDAKARKECGDPDNVYCEYNIRTHEHYCRCRITDYFYDPYDMRCKECECGPDGNCSFVKGNKTCHCRDGYAVSDYDYHWLYGKTTLCKECDCGTHGKCHFDGWTKVCDCDQKHEDNDGTCEACYCGPYGDCSFQNGNKTCACQDGYGVDYNGGLFPGICQNCYCYLGHEQMNCTFSSGIKYCICPTGYEQSYGSCVDINECWNPNACPHNSICENKPGSYECRCKQGHRPNNEGEVKKYGCDDINECLESLPCPFTDTTDCINIIGSYMCVCKSGYVPQSKEKSPKYIGCWEDQSSWQFGYIFLIVLFSLISLGLVIGICKRYRKNQ